MTNWRGWVVVRGSCVLGSGLCIVLRASWVVGRASCVIAHASLTRLLLVEFKDTVFLYTTLRIYEKIFSDKNQLSKFISEICSPRSSPIFPCVPRTL